MAKFKLFWENNPDTPITADRLSSAIDYFSQERILYTEGSDPVQLKIANDVKVSVPVNKTLLFVDFNNSLINYNGLFSPTISDNILFSPSYNQSPGSIMIDEGVENIITNPGFEDGLTDWTVENSASGADYEISSSRYYPTLNSIGNLKSLKTSITESGAWVRVSRQLNIQTGDRMSLSFYYSSSRDSSYKIKTKISGVDNYWNGVGWTESPQSFSIPNSSSEWRRIELQNVVISSLSVLEIEVEFNQLGEYYLDSFLFERKQYCSTYHPSISPAPLLAYSKDVINYERGTVDFSFAPKIVNDATYFLLTDLSGHELIKFYYNNFDKSFNIQLYNSQDDSYLNFKQNYILEINRWERVVFDWDLETGFVNMYLANEKKEFGFIPDNFTPVDYYSLDKVYIGSNPDSTNSIKSLLEYVRISSYQKEESAIFDDYGTEPKPESLGFNVFSSPAESTLLDANYLDQGSFTINTEYFIWLRDNFDRDSSDVIISTSPFQPYNNRWFECRKIGGFYTDESGSIDPNSIWDISTKEKTIHTERFLVGGMRTRNIDDTSDDSQLTPIEFKTSSNGGSDDATFNLDTYFTKHIYGRNRADGNFLNIDTQNGEVYLDSLHFDGHSINGDDSDLELYTTNSNTISVHSNEVQINSEGLDIKLDDLRVVNNTIYSALGSPLIIDSTIEGPENIQIISQNSIFSSTNDTSISASGDVNISGVNYNLTSTNAFNLSSSTINLEGSNGVNINSTEQVVRVEDVKFNDNRIFRNDGNDDSIIIDSTGDLNLSSLNGYVGVEDLHFNQNRLFYNDVAKASVYFYNNADDATKEDLQLSADGKVVIDSPLFHVKSPEIWFEADITDKIRLDLIKINQNQIYTDQSTDIDIVSSAHLGLSAISNVNASASKINFSTTENEINLDSFTIDGSNITMSNDWSVGSTTHELTLSGQNINIDANSGVVNITNNVNMASNILSGEVNFTTPSNIVLNFTSLGDLDPATDAFNIGEILSGSGDTLNFDLTHTHDGRYYRKTDSDNLYLKRADGGTVSGDIFMDDALLEFSPNLTGNEKRLIGFDAYGLISYHDGMKFKSGVNEYNIISAGDGGSYIKLDSSVATTNDGITLSVSSASEGAAYSEDNVVRLSTNGLTTGRLNVNNYAYMNSRLYVGDGYFAENNTSPGNSGTVGFNGDFYAYRVYNAVWNDLAECWDKDNNHRFYPGLVVVQTESGIRPAKKRAEKGSIGIISASYGYLLGAEGFDSNDFDNSKSLPIAISGRVETIYSKKLTIGDEVVASKTGGVVKANLFERVFKRGCILGRVDSVSDKTNCIIKVY